MFLMFLLLLAGTFLLIRRGQLGQFGPPPWLNRPSPEAEAKKILAERFARGDIDPADFMERASVLNWTPGSDVISHRRPNKRKCKVMRCHVSISCVKNVNYILLRYTL